MNSVIGGSLRRIRRPVLKSCLYCMAWMLMDFTLSMVAGVRVRKRQVVKSHGVKKASESARVAW